MFRQRLICLQLRTRLGKEKRPRELLPVALLQFVAPQVGLEPTTLRLTAECSAIELLRNKRLGREALFIADGYSTVNRSKLAHRHNLREYLQP